jgi:hypothetical protein
VERFGVGRRSLMTNKKLPDHVRTFVAEAEAEGGGSPLLVDRVDELLVPRSTFSPGLVRNPAESAAITLWLEQICASVEPDAVPIVRSALIHETAAHASDDWLTVARAALSHVLEAPDVDRATAAQLDDNLKDAIAKGLPNPSDEEVLQHTGELVATMVTSWLEVLRKLVDAHRTVTLDEYLLPPKSLDETLFALLMRSLEPFAVGKGDGAGTIMRSLARVLLNEDAEVQLPYKLRLEIGTRANDGSLKSAKVSRSAPQPSP